MAADFAILMEPSNAVVEAGCQGTLRVEVRTTGERAHSARAWRGVNAIHGAAEVLARLNAYDARRPVIDGLEYHEGLNAVGIRGGVAGNVLPDVCVVEVNFRFAPDRTEAEAEAVRPRVLRRLRRHAHRHRPRRAPRPRPARRQGVRRGRRRRGQPQVRLDRRRPLHRPRRPRRQLRPRRPDAGPQAGGARAGRADRALRGPAPRLAHQLTLRLGGRGGRAATVSRPGDLGLGPITGASGLETGAARLPRPAAGLPSATSSTSGGAGGPRASPVGAGRPGDHGTGTLSRGEKQAEGPGHPAARPGRRHDHRPAAARLPRPHRLGAHRPVAGAADPGRVRGGLRRAGRAGAGDRRVRLGAHAGATTRRTRSREQLGRRAGRGRVRGDHRRRAGRDGGGQQGRQRGGRASASGSASSCPSSRASTTGSTSASTSATSSPARRCS